jgi:hypothetical protein
MLHRVRIDVGSGIKAYELDDGDFRRLEALTARFGNQARNDVPPIPNSHGFIPGTHYAHGVPDDVGEE